MQGTRKIFILFLLALGLLTIVCCSPKTGNKVLSFFFDGVPGDPETQIVLASDSLIQVDSSDFSEIPIIAKPSYVFHNPYLKKICDVCHNNTSLGEMVMEEPDMCYQCHDDYSWENDFLHGPVASGYCTACHNPHMSTSEYLLVETGQALCLNCHDPKWIFKNEMHEGIEEYACTECHNPHGGDTWNFY